MSGKRRNTGLIGGEPGVMITSDKFFAALDGLPRRVRMAMKLAPYVVSPVDIVNALKNGNLTENSALRFIDYVMNDITQREALRLYGPTHPQAAPSGREG